MIGGVFTPGESAVHRASPGHKILALFLFAILISSVDTTLWLLLWTGAVPVLWVLAHLSLRMLGQALRPVVWILLVVVGFQLVVAGPTPAIHIAIKLVSLIGAAALVSVTTRTDDMLASVQRALQPLRRFGFPAKQVGFALVFVIRLVPFVSLTGRSAREARMARGGSGNWLPVLVPTIIRLMRESDVMAEALVARGFERN